MENLTYVHEVFGAMVKTHILMSEELTHQLKRSSLNMKKRKSDRRIDELRMLNMTGLPQ